MPYYKIDKNNFLNFIKEYQEVTDITPKIVLPSETIDSINKAFSQIQQQNKSTKIYSIINNSLAKAIEYQNTIFGFIFEQYILNNFTPEENEFLNKLFLKYNITYTKKFNYSEKLESLKKLLKMTDNDHFLVLNMLYKNYSDKNDVKKYAESVISKFLDTELRFDKYQQIQLMISEGTQKHIIDVNFGNDTNVPTQPIKNIDGLLQSYALNYAQYDSIIIHSTNQLKHIYDSLKIDRPLYPLNEQDYEHLLDTKNFYISLDDILKSNNFILSNKSQVSQEVINENPMLEILDLFKDENTTNSERFNLLIRGFELFSLSESHNSRNDLSYINQMSSHIATLLDNVIMDDYIKKVRSIFDDIYRIEEEVLTISQNFNEDFYNLTEKHRNILCFISPFSVAMCNNLLSDNFVNKLKNSLSSTEFLFLHINAYSLFNNKYQLSSKNIVNNEYSFSGGICFNQNVLINRYVNVNINIEIEKYVKNFKEQLPTLMDEIKSSKLFTPLHQDLYPFLSLKNKLDPKNYSVVLEEHKFFNHFEKELTVSLPGNLLLDDDIFDYVYKKITESKNFLSLHERYLGEALCIRFMKFCENFNNEPQHLLSSHLNLDKVSSNLLNHFLIKVYGLEQQQTFEFIAKYSEFLKTKNINVKDSLIFSKICTLPQYCTINLNTNAKDTLQIFNTFNQNNTSTNVLKTAVVDSLINDTQYLKEYDDIILDIYYNENNCFSYLSKTKIINFFRKNIDSIINYHLNNTTFSTNNFLNTDVLSSTKKSNFYTKPLINEIQKKALEYAKVFPNLISKIEDNIFKDPTTFIDIIKFNFSAQKYAVNLHSTVPIQLISLFDNIPFKILDSNTIFDVVLDDFLDQSKKTLNEENQIYVLNRFNPAFFKQEHTIIKIINKFKGDYDHSSRTEFLRIINKVNPELENFLNQIKDQDVNLVIDNIKNIQMTRIIFENKEEITPSTNIKKFKF